MNQEKRNQMTPEMVIGALNMLQWYLHDQGMPTMAMSVAKIIDYFKDRGVGEDAI